MFGLIPKKIELPFNATIERVTEALQTPQAGLRVHIDGQRFKLVYGPNLKEPVSVVEGWLMQDTQGCFVSGSIRWSRANQVFLLVVLAFLTVFCFGIPGLMIRSYLMGTMTSTVGHPPAIPLIWAAATAIPFFLLLRTIFRSRLPDIERRLSKIILGDKA
jgi:hypothetical protein